MGIYSYIISFLFHYCRWFVTFQDSADILIQSLFYSVLPGHPCLNFFAESDTPHPCPCNTGFTTFRNRRSREASILQSIENGAQTLFEVVSKTYSDVDRKLWIPASFNVRLHVDHLNSQHKLPKVRVRNIAF